MNKLWTVYVGYTRYTLFFLRDCSNNFSSIYMAEGEQPSGYHYSRFLCYIISLYISDLNYAILALLASCLDKSNSRGHDKVTFDSYSMYWMKEMGREYWTIDVTGSLLMVFLGVRFQS